MPVVYLLVACISAVLFVAKLPISRRFSTKNIFADTRVMRKKRFNDRDFPARLLT
jgi:hypothetical protein